ncbi:hypothetical protein GGR56DRAFT_669629 [Xylariaceae sp. FL0804]|nr:hypothetical protein GGR56DRAFT_669629 [Xylariaceae sp. FL0804]
MDKIENAVDGEDAARQDQQNPSDAGKDSMVDSAVDKFASSEGAPAAADPEINNVVNDEVNKI